MGGFLGRWWWWSYHFRPLSVSPDTMVQSPRLVQQAVPAGAADTPEVKAAAMARMERLRGRESDAGIGTSKRL